MNNSEEQPSTSIHNDHGLLAKPLHVQRLENAVRLEPFLDYVENMLKKPNSSDNEEDIASGFNFDEEMLSDSLISKQEKRCDRYQLYNFSKMKKSRKWLKDILLSSESSDSQDSDNSSVTEEDFQDMLKMHKMQKTAQVEFQNNPELKQYQYYSTGLLSNYDKFYDHQKLTIGGKRKLNEKSTEKRKAKIKKIKVEGGEKRSKEGEKKKGESRIPKTEPGTEGSHRKRHPKKKNTASHEAVMNMKRRRLWIALCKKEINRAVKQKSAAHKEVLTAAKKLALACQREVRRSALLSQKVAKEVPSRARRLTKEMMLYWKRYEKVEKEHRRKAEKEAQEQLKMDIELREAKRQQRKLNFLITQTELYAHFMSRKLPGLQDVQEKHILSQLEEPGNETVPSSSSSLLERVDDSYDVEEMKSIALRNAEDALNTHVSQVNVFDGSLPNDVKKKQSELREAFDGNLRLSNPSIKNEKEFPQPAMFVGKLKSYQLKGMNWLYSLYDKGINGILADEMGLGKTVQTIVFLATLIKAQGIWGPFLVIAPASTLHNWQQEFTKFVPKFKVLPYWGNTSDRKVLRKFWSQKDLHTENASFHVLITSYQLVVQDVKYFQRIKWQYMVLDEAQAIKSTSSVRWKILLGFNCRNRLLLTGTPIQNSMAELWALLHFIMPTLFDSHEEFNEWFSKDIESHAENKSVIDEKHLSRLHKILQPFMLRRVKKDVENELSDKIEIQMHCQLTQRQKALYQGLRNKISIDDLMVSSSSSSQSQSATSSLLNLVMQFRKVCNHPDLFEKREVKHPYYFKHDEPHYLPKLIFREGLLHESDPAKIRILTVQFGIFQPDYIHRALFSSKCQDCGFSFLRFVDMSVGELYKIFTEGLLAQWQSAYFNWKAAYRIHQTHLWKTASKTKYLNRKDFILQPLNPIFSFANCYSELDLVFTDNVSSVYGFSDWKITPSRKLTVKAQNEQNQTNSNEPMNSKILECQLSYYPSFLADVYPKVVAASKTVYSADASLRWWSWRKQLCGSPLALKVVRAGCSEAFDPLGCCTVADPWPLGGLKAVRPPNGWSKIIIPDRETHVMDSGKLTVLDGLLNKLKAGDHRVLIYSQMTRMIDLLEEYMWHRKHTYMRLDGSSKISDRRDMVADFQTRSDIFVFLLSTRAGGLGINLTAADTVIFYDSDWNPTVDQQAMDRAHRLGQTKQVTVYRLVCKGSIEERILQRAREKSEIQRMVISGGSFKPDTLKPKEVVSLLLDDDELERKFRSRQEERKQLEKLNQERKKKTEIHGESKRGGKRKRKDEIVSLLTQDADSGHSVDSIPPSPYSEHSTNSLAIAIDENSSDASLIVDDGSPLSNPSTSLLFDSIGPKSHSTPQGKKSTSGRSRGRPRGSGRRGNGRGRANLMATAAAELAGAQAGKSAAFAAYGYALTGAKSPSGSSPIQPANLARGSRGTLRGAVSLSAQHMPRGGLGRGSQKTPITNSTSLGFYLPDEKQ